MSAWEYICAVEHSGAKGMTRLVLIGVARHAPDCYARQDTIAREVGVHRATVQRHLDRLAADGLVERRLHGHQSGTNRYRMVLCAPCRTERQKGESNDRPPLSAAQSGRGRRTERRHLAAQSGRNPQKEPPSREDGAERRPRPILPCRPGRAVAVVDSPGPNVGRWETVQPCSPRPQSLELSSGHCCSALR